MNWTDYEEQYGESREDFVEVDEDETHECFMCVESFIESTMNDRFYELNNKYTHVYVCMECTPKFDQEYKKSLIL